eukprot:Polyplicarium_translucidae@DN5397_c0_g1_i1.p1
MLVCEAVLSYFTSRLLYFFVDYSARDFETAGKWSDRIGAVTKGAPWIISFVLWSWILLNLAIFVAVVAGLCRSTLNETGISASTNCRIFLSNCCGESQCSLELSSSAAQRDKWKCNSLAHLRKTGFLEDPPQFGTIGEVCNMTLSPMSGPPDESFVAPAEKSTLHRQQFYMGLGDMVLQVLLGTVLV